jgi:hypothetical protein
MVGCDAWKWYSGDYSAATDDIHGELGQSVLEEILVQLPEDMQFEPWVHATRLSLAFHHLEAGGRWPEGERPNGLQARGQLMGSRASFVILCLLNLLSVRLADRAFFGDDTKRPVLINGDDLLCRRPSGWDRFHRVEARRIGLITNDKTFFHPKYCSVNSISFLYDPAVSVRDDGSTTDVLLAGHSTPWQIEYLPVGHYFGQQKVLRDEEGEQSFSAIEALRRALPHGTPYFRRMMAKVKPQCNGRNLFLPSVLGGFGLVPPPNWRWFVTETQLREAVEITKRVELTPLPPVGPTRTLSHVLVKSSPYSGPTAVLACEDWFRVPVVGNRKALKSGAAVSNVLDLSVRLVHWPVGQMNLPFEKQEQQENEPAENDEAVDGGRL